MDLNKQSLTLKRLMVHLRNGVERKRTPIVKWMRKLLESGSDIEFSSVQSPVVKERTLSRRAATKVIKYSLSDDEEEDKSEPDMFVNEAVKENILMKKINHHQDMKHQKICLTLCGKKKDESTPPLAANKRKKIDKSQSDSDDEDRLLNKKTKVKSISSDDDDDFVSTKKVTKTKPKEDKPKKPRQKKKRNLVMMRM
ncbi:hypothetical protein NQ317_012300 [Molorchus minor]|uniref:Uncharacterized protein n=1 Tax=Molorchus minor TaxID=1323400 RepID=A0ABQ9J1L6_9CUCU|nr:hypothetical protein NQ317_012300 [Molorchus minor]